MLSFSSIDVSSRMFDLVPPLSHIPLAGVLNIDVGGEPGVKGSGFMEEICTDCAVSERLPRSSIEIMLGSEKSSSSAWLARNLLVDVTVKERLTVMPPSDVRGSGVDDGLLPRRPRRDLDGPRQLSGMSRSASFFLDEAVVPKTTKMKMPGVVPGMKRMSVCIARPALRSGADAFESFMLFCNAVNWNKVLVHSNILHVSQNVIIMM